MRLIDADKLKTHYSWWTDETKELFDTIINLQPTIEAELVVRCKDCKHNQLPPTKGNAECELWCGMTDLYGYCHYGERREE